jgi:hypothetical protein
MGTLTRIRVKQSVGAATLLLESNELTAVMKERKLIARLTLSTYSQNRKLP